MEPQPVPVTADNFARAETDRYFGSIVAQGGLGAFMHHREPARIDAQTVVRMNRDTLYSSAVFDLDAGPVTITMPDPGPRFMSIQVFDQDEYSPLVAYGAGSHTLARQQIGTRYAAAVRTLVDPADANDIAEVHHLQDAITVSQPGGPGRFEVPTWDQESQTKVRNALIVLGDTLPDGNRMFGTKDQVDPVRHLIGSATGWGGNPETEATYIMRVPKQNDGTTVHRLTVKDVPVDGFWSISVYNKEGYFEPNDLGAYSVNNITAQRDADGAISVQFGGCDGSVPNCLPIVPGWNYAVRLHRPRPEILEGSWTFPADQPV
jgi:hypothetical protein